MNERIRNRKRGKERDLPVTTSCALVSIALSVHNTVPGNTRNYLSFDVFFVVVKASGNSENRESLSLISVSTRFQKEPRHTDATIAAVRAVSDVICSESRLVTPRECAATWPPPRAHADPHAVATSMAGVSLRNCGKINLQPLTPRPLPSPQFAFEPAHSFQFIKLAPLVHQPPCSLPVSSFSRSHPTRTMSVATARGEGRRSGVNTYDTKSLTRFSERVAGEL